ncbi:rhomboid family intramembrane serine protease [Geomonas nitrogeniifigens]|uniref:Rhomboid family intramembrane serine protease n=1 Tax=Geomonas diazotrophica TaxID=2843197 RepID=A0ABX8JNB3_9BACT|nr:rhomboid family intramembrane serine protease [Geomonas nitrogeniifigens]QWV99456.1 rhomboid family intramembrane serine protease [Geomonas nitrogeniifigens]
MERPEEETCSGTAAPLVMTSEEGSDILSGMTGDQDQDQNHSVEPRDDWRIVPVWRVEERGRKLSMRQARLWALVLESRYIECRLEPGPRGWQLWVAPENYDAACRELHLYVEENRNWPPFLPPVHPMKENTLPTLSILVLLATFHNLTNLDLKILGHYPVDWLAIGNAHAGLILQGEWWRLVTALTLHADALHLISNLAIGGVFIVYLCRDLGSGLAWTLLLASGVCGNLANAYIQLPSHTSVGASTAVFGTVGILGALTMMRYRHHLRRRWPLPIAAALSLLVLLGTEGERTDLGAHLFGFLFGCLFGFAAELLVGHVGRPGRLANALLALASASVVGYAWWLAIAQSG